eukprot:TRINITY_DN6676_c0_g1_i1.p1 TRINITY_DN6676_c0_g1~~TRINITY_DN6676_c0_g1_i1.p1  ORF type:complete len:494 (-),score=125.34 TRINITY_DN6676_c0_g1_i1:1488-2969(-)
MPKEQRRRRKKKKQVHNQAASVGFEASTDEQQEDYEIEYVGAKDAIPQELADHFVGVFAKFAKPEELTSKEAKNAEYSTERINKEAEKEEEETVVEKSLSKKQLKKKARPSVAALKQKVERPDLVESWDANAEDPIFLCYLKGYRNTVPIPKHWGAKRRYLQGKRGISKGPFDLPDFIKATGIARMRDAAHHREENKSLATKARERVRPKLGKMDIDYQVLHDAFFKYQTKPHLSIHGDLYFEGKEFEPRLRDKRPGASVSADLREALGMADNAPPPWLVNMQRYGPPPAYPALKIPGLNAPIPPGASFGFHPGGWGKPPVNEFGQPLYGDVFGTSEELMAHREMMKYVDKTRWGELEEEDEQEEVSADEEADEDDEVPQAASQPPPPPKPTQSKQQPRGGDMSGIQSVQSVTGLETPEMIDIRKRPTGPAQLFTVLPQQDLSNQTSGFMGSVHQYVVPGGDGAFAPSDNKRKAEVKPGSKQPDAKKYKDFKF